MSILRIVHYKNLGHDHPMNFNAVGNIHYVRTSRGYLSSTQAKEISFVTGQKGNLYGFQS